MAIRNIVLEGDEILKKRARDIEKIDDRILTLLDDMVETMYANHGVGLAAPQVGIMRRAIVVDTGDGLVQLINPELLEADGTQTGEEGCLSIPGVVALVERPHYVKVQGLNREGSQVMYEATGFMARAFCHEIDHLSGTLFIDHPHELVDQDKEEKGDEKR